MKIPISIIRRLHGRIIVYLDDIILSREELLVLRDTLIYLLQNLGFVINVKKSVLVHVRNYSTLGC